MHNKSIEDVTKVLRVVDPIVTQVVSEMLATEDYSLELMEILSLFLQMSDRLNYSILSHLIKNP